MQQIYTKSVWYYTRLGDPLGIVQEIKIWPHKQVVYAQLGILHGALDTQTFLKFWDTKSDSQQKKK